MQDPHKNVSFKKSPFQQRQSGLENNEEIILRLR